MEKENIPLIDELNEFTGGKYNFTLKSASLTESADFCVIEILYKDGTLISPELKSQLEEKLRSLAPKRFKYELHFIKNYISPAKLSADILEFLKTNFSSVFFNLGGVEQEDKKFNISLIVDNLSFDHAKTKKLDEQICSYLKEKYEDYDFTCNLSAADVFKEDEEKNLIENYREEETDSSLVRKIDFSDLVMLFGENIEGSAAYIKDKDSPEKNVVLCGKITSIRSFRAKKKPKKDDGKQEEVKEKQEDEEPAYERKFYKFELADFTGSISCIYFSNKETQKEAEKLEVGSVIAVKLIFLFHSTNKFI